MYNIHLVRILSDALLVRFTESVFYAIGLLIQVKIPTSRRPTSKYVPGRITVHEHAQPTYRVRVRVAKPSIDSVCSVEVTVDDFLKKKKDQGEKRTYRGYIQ